MKSVLSGILLAVLLSVLCFSACRSRELTGDKREKIDQFLKSLVAATMKEDYRSHNIFIDVQVTRLTVDRIAAEETKQDIRYFIVGTVSYIVKGGRTWRDREGNTIDLGPEQEITHWFSAGILEDRYMGEFLKDEKNRLTYYADKPA
jgi:hypothetical protein